VHTALKFDPMDVKYIMFFCSRRGCKAVRTFLVISLLDLNPHPEFCGPIFSIYHMLYTLYKDSSRDLFHNSRGGGGF
jgi:hypothetical protein